MTNHRESKRPAQLFAFLLFFALPGFLEAATLSIQPPTITVTTGQSFSVDVRIQDVTDLYAFQIDLGLDPSILQFQSISEGPFLLYGGSTFFIEGTYDPILGTLSGTLNSLMGPLAGVSGDGVLARLTLLAVAEGVSPIAIDGAATILLNSALYGIDATTGLGSVTVTAVPEPSQLGILAGLLACAGAARVRRRARRAPEAQP